MGNDKRKRTKQTPDTDNSDFDENSQTPSTSTNDTSPQHFPRFILVESKEENRQITSLSPFLIQKIIQSIAGEPENIKKLHRSNQLLIEVSKKAHAENLLRAQTFHDLKVRVYPHTSLNSSKGVIRCPELRNCSEEEILEGTRSQGVTGVKRFKIKQNGELKDTNTFVFTFNTPVLPKTVKVAYFRVNVEVYVPNTLRCLNCQNMDTMRIGVLKTLSVRNAVKQENTSKIDVATNYTVSIVVKNTVLTLKNAEFGTKKRKSCVSSSPEIFLSLKRGNLLRPQLQYLESVTPTSPSLQ